MPHSEDDLIFVMERRHRSQLQQRFGSLLRQKRLIVLSIPDDYDFMQTELVELLRLRVGPYTPNPIQYISSQPVPEAQWIRCWMLRPLDSTNFS